MKFLQFYTIIPIFSLLLGLSSSVKIYLLFCVKEDTEKKLEFRKVFVGMSMESAPEPKMNQLCIAMISKLENWGIINGMKESIGKH